jgi:putative spermidine/putrescine transport system permease protein
MSRVFHALVALLYVFLLGPIAIVVVMSFSNDNYLAFPPAAWGVKWYVALAGNAQFLGAFGASVAIGALATLAAVLAGVPAAYAIARVPFRGRATLFALFTAPLLLPSIVLGLAILLVFVRVDLVSTYPGLVLSHLVLCLPFVVRIVATGLGAIPPALEEAAASLGATPLAAFRRVTLPLMLPAVLASMALSFIVSFDEVVVSLFLIGPKLTTLPVELMRYVAFRADPQVAVVGTVLVAITIFLVILIERSVGLMRALGR